MKKLLFIFIITSTLAFSQQEAGVWYFGQNAGIKFQTDGSVTALTDGQLNTSEGCATIADTNGNLLFYTDGTTVYNRNHQVMVNGTGLMGNVSTSQSATIVPLPGSSTLFYIFTLDYEVHPNGFRYSIVDISLNGGLGDLTSSKNVLIYTPSDEKLSIVKHANNIDYWIVTHGWNNNTFYSYLLTSSGLSAVPVSSNSGFVVTGTTDNVWGTMKISPDGSKLAMSHSIKRCELFDFDVSTGIVSNPLTLYSGDQHYGVEFSPNSKVLYLSTTFSSPLKKIIQYDLSASDILASAYYINNPLSFHMALQLGPNGKIYVAQLFDAKLSVINDPNIIGAGCNFQSGVIDLAGRVCQFGLPPFISSYFDLAFTAKNLCLNSNTQFTLSSTSGITSVTWDFGDGTPLSNAVNPVHLYTNAGTYQVTATITGAIPITKSKSITISAVPIITTTIANQSVCGTVGANYDLSQHNSALLGSQSASVYGVAYFSSMADAAIHSNVLPTNYSLPSGTKTFYAKVYNLANTSCYAIGSFDITLFQAPTANAPTANWICDDSSNDGVGLFNLGVNSAIVLGSQSSTQFAVSYHLSQNDADTNSNALPLSYQNISNPQTIYVRVQNNLSASCFSTTSFQIGLYAMPIIANPPVNLYACDMGNDTRETFDLSQQTATILGSQSAANYTVSYHASQIDANFGNNDLTLNFANTSNPQTIYARVENNASPSCFATTSFQLQVKAAPVLIMDDVYANCEGTIVTIAAPLGFSSYDWSNGATTSSTSITTAGNYSLTVTRDYGTISCPTTKSFAVYNSNKATITAIETRDWTDNQNMIVVQLSSDGKGDYEYSLDGIHYQNSAIFEGLPSGEYTVYVNDKKGCGEVTEQVFLLMYPKFFTPNGDGFNDTWYIKFSNSEPDMELQIFDRYGKIITSFKGLDFGWDGTFNGKLEFADDYWFVVKRENGKEFRGHFSLLR